MDLESEINFKKKQKKTSICNLNSCCCSNVQNVLLKIPNINTINIIIIVIIIIIINIIVEQLRSSSTIQHAVTPLG